VSYSGLVFDEEDAKCSHELALDVVPFIVHRRPAQRRDGRRVVHALLDRLAVLVLERFAVQVVIALFDKGLVARCFRELRNAVHRPVEGLRLVPVRRARGTIPNLGYPQGIDSELIRRSSLGTERTSVDGTFRIALDIDDFAVAHAYELAAADCAIRTHARHL